MKNNQEKKFILDKKRTIHQEGHVTIPSRLEGVVKNSMMNSSKKKKKER